MLGRRHEPTAWVPGDARNRPLLERGYKGVLCELFGDANVTDDAGEAGDNPGGLNPPHGIDRVM
jgi:hypothetical protein